jgi:hypothetical protein
MSPESRAVAGEALSASYLIEDLREGGLAEKIAWQWEKMVDAEAKRRLQAERAEVTQINVD